VYPVSLGFDEAERRMRALIANGHHAEALTTAVFSFEKTMRRALLYFAVARGFTSKQAQHLIGKRGFHDLKDMWSCFDPKYRSLPQLVGAAAWQQVANAVTMRNKLVHGERVYKLTECKDAAERVLTALCLLRGVLKADVGFEGWSRLPTRRKAALPWLAKRQLAS
jgi:hypothetical protein